MRLSWYALVLGCGCFCKNDGGQEDWISRCTLVDAFTSTPALMQASKSSQLLLHQGASCDAHIRVGPGSFSAKPFMHRLDPAHYCRLHCTCPGKENLSLAAAQRAQPSRRTAHQVSYFCLGKCDASCNSMLLHKRRLAWNKSGSLLLDANAVPIRNLEIGVRHVSIDDELGTTGLDQSCIMRMTGIFFLTSS